MTSFAQAQAEGLCLRYPDNLGIHQDINAEAAINMLIRGTQLAGQTPFVWQFIDKPQDGNIFLLILPTHSPAPIDGIRYQDTEKRMVYNFGQRELEVHEIRYGFIPGVDAQAARCRRRFRLIKGGFSQLVLLHYFRGQSAQIMPNLNQPVRNYPLRTPNEPAVYILGDKAGQRVYPPGMGPSHSQSGMAPGMPMGVQPGMAIPGMPMSMSQQQAMLAQQNSSMEMLERRREREAAARRSTQRARVDDDDSADENDQISARTLALTRYRRNHDFMNEVFHYAAFSDTNAPPQKHPLSVFNQTELEEKIEKLKGEIQSLEKTGADQRARLEAEINPLGGDMVAT